MVRFQIAVQIAALFEGGGKPFSPCLLTPMVQEAIRCVDARPRDSVACQALGIRAGTVSQIEHPRARGQAA